MPNRTARPTLRSRLAGPAALALAAWLAAPASGQTTSVPEADAAEVVVTADLLAERPERFGANVDVGGYAAWSQNSTTINNWTADPGFEPTVCRRKFVATGGDATHFESTAAGGLGVWDTVGEGFFDGAAVRVYRDEGGRVSLLREGTVASYSPANNRFAFAEPGPAVREGDVAFLALVRGGTPTAEQLHPRMARLAESGPWRQFGPVTAERDATSSAPADGGAACLKISSTGGEQGGVRQYAYGSPADYFNAPVPGRTYRVEAWMRQTGIPGGRVRYESNQDYRDVGHTFEGVGGEWGKHSFEFVAPEVPEKGAAAAEHVLSFEGPGTLWVDNLVVYDTSMEPFAVRPEAVEAMAAFRPGPVRIWSGHTNILWGTTLDNWTDPEASTKTAWSTDHGVEPGTQFKLPTALAFCERTGGTPWLIVHPSFSEAEWQGLVEYLAGPADSPYGRKRAEQGRAEPWTDAFDVIRVELGNETWNGMFQPWTFAGPDQFGRFAEYFFAQARASPHFGRARGKVEFVVGGWVIQTTEHGYGQAAAREAPSAAVVGVTAYLGGWEAGGTVGGDAVTDEGFADTLRFTPRLVAPVTDRLAATRDAIAAAGVRYDLGTYEGGPGYDLPSGDRPFDPVQERYGKSLAAGVTTLDAYLYNAAAGYGPQAYFLFQPGANWSSHSPVATGFNPYPAWLALQMRNALGSGDMVRVDVARGPTADFDAYDWHGVRVPARRGVPLVGAYAFKNGSTVTTFLLSRRLDGTTPVTLRLPGTPSGRTATVHTLTGDPRANNIESLAVSIGKTTAPIDGDTVALNLPAGSVYAVTVEGVDVPTDRDAKPPTRSVAEGPADAPKLAAPDAAPPTVADPSAVRAADDFDGPEVSADPTPLHGRDGGVGWARPWQVQNGESAGYAVTTDAPMRPAAAGGHAVGGRAYLSAGRALDVAGAMPDLSTPGPDGAALVGRPGATVWLAATLRKGEDNAQPTHLSLHAGNVAWNAPAPALRVGYPGPAADDSRGRHWSLAVGKGDSAAVAPGPALAEDAAALLVVELKYADDGTATASLYVDPAPGASPPGTPDATLAVPAGVARFRAVAWYAGDAEGQSSLDALRVGPSFASVTAAE